MLCLCKMRQHKDKLTLDILWMFFVLILSDFQVKSLKIMALFSLADEHVSRVWQDSNNDTPARSPGSPRPRSPTTGRRGGPTQPARPTPPSQHIPKVPILTLFSPSFSLSYSLSLLGYNRLQQIWYLDLTDEVLEVPDHWSGFQKTNYQNLLLWSWIVVNMVEYVAVHCFNLHSIQITCQF